MRSLVEALVEELDPETKKAVKEVCDALDDPWGVPTGELGPRFGFALYQAAKYGPPECRQRIIAAVEAGVREDPEVFISAGQHGGKSGYLYTREQIRQYDGDIGYIVDSQTGESQTLLRWPTGYYAGGAPCYDKREAA